MHWPQLGVGAVVRHRDMVLLVQRGRPPGKGMWSIPGGKVLPGESMKCAVAREILEETGIEIRVGELAYHFEFIEHDAAGELLFHYVVLDFYGKYVSGDPCAGDDASDARWVRFDEMNTLAWNESSRMALQQLFPDAWVQA